MSIIIPSRNIYEKKVNSISNKKLGAVEMALVDASSEETTTGSISFGDIDVTNSELSDRESAISEKHNVTRLTLGTASVQNFVCVDAICFLKKESRAIFPKIIGSDDKKYVSLFKGNGITNTKNGKVKVSINGTIISRDVTAKRTATIFPSTARFDFEDFRNMKITYGDYTKEYATWSFDERVISTSIKSSLDNKETIVSTDPMYLDDDNIVINEIGGYDARAYIESGDVLCGMSLIKLTSEKKIIGVSGQTKVEFSYTGTSIDYIPSSISISVNDCEVLNKKLDEETVVIGDTFDKKNIFRVEKNELVQKGSGHNSKTTNANLLVKVVYDRSNANYKWSYYFEGKQYSGVAVYYTPSSNKEPYTLELKHFSQNNWIIDTPPTCNVEMLSGNIVKLDNVPIGIYGDTFYFIFGYGAPNMGSGSFPPTELETTILLAISKSFYSDDLVGESYKKTLDNYKDGKETATIRCSISKYYDENDILMISDENGKMSFDIYDVVTPYTYGGEGKDVPFSLKKDGTPKNFQVVGIKFIYDGAVWQELTLQEV